MSTHMPELSNWSVLVSKMVLMENFLHHLYTSYMNEPFKVDFDGGEAKGGDFKSGPGRERGFRRKTSNCICICCFHCSRILPEKSDFKIRRYKVQGTYRTLRDNLLCIFRVRESRSEKWHRLHLQLCPREVQLPKYLLDAEFVERIISREMSSIAHINHAWYYQWQHFPPN